MPGRSKSAPPSQLRRATIADVAKAAGVSPSTASRALNGSGYAAEHVREQVRAAAERIGYVPDANARTLRQRTSRSVGVVISDLRNPFYADLAAGAEQRLREAGYSMTLVNDDGLEDEEMRAVQTFVALRVPGVIVTPVSGRALNTLRRHGVHVVQADRVVGRPRSDAVLSGNEAGARELTRHLLELGHRRIALLIDETKWTTGAGRLAGYRAAHEEMGVPVDDELTAYASFDVEQARVAAARLIDAHRDLTALFAANNVLAQAVVQEVQQRGLRVPEDISIAAYDDVPWMSMVRPGLTTVSQHTVELGRRCADLLLDRMTGDAVGTRARTVHLEPELKVRGSTGKPRRAKRLPS